MNSKQTKLQQPQLTSNGLMKKKMIHWLPTILTHIVQISLQMLSVVKILPKEADHEKKATFGGTFDFQIILQGKDKRVGG